MGMTVTDEMREKSTKFEQLKEVITQYYPEFQSNIDNIIKDVDGFLLVLTQHYEEGSTDETYKAIIAEIKSKVETLNISDAGGALAYVYFKHPDANTVKQAILYDIASQQSELREPLAQVDPDVNRSGMAF